VKRNLANDICVGVPRSRRFFCKR